MTEDEQKDSEQRNLRQDATDDEIRKVTDEFTKRMSQNEDKIKGLHRKAVMSGVVSSVIGLSVVVGVSYFILGPRILEDMTRKKDAQVASLQQGYEQVKEKQEELMRVQQNIRAELRAFVASDLAAQISKIDNLNDQVRMVNERMAALQTTPTGRQFFGESIGDLQSMVLGMSGRVENLETALEEAKKENTALSDMLEGVTGKELKAAAMLMAVSQLRSSLNQEQSFDKDLMTVQRLSGDDPEMLEALRKLEPHAKSGVLTLGNLKSEFKGLAGDIVMAELAGEDVSWKDKAMQRLGNIIKVRKVGEVEGQDTQAVVARAEKLIDAGDISGAIAELQALEGKPKEKADVWIQEAEARLMADQVSSLMTNNILQKLSGGTSGLTNLIQQLPGQNPLQGVDMGVITTPLQGGGIQPYAPSRPGNSDNPFGIDFE